MIHTHQLPPSAARVEAEPTATSSLSHIASSNPGKLTLTLALVALENALFLAYPLFAGFAVNAIIAGNALSAASYAGIVLSFWVVGAARRAVDTRVYTGIYAGIAVRVALEQGSRGGNVSTVAARVVLAREFVDFFDKHLPTILTSLVSLVGAVGMLLILEPLVGAVSVAALLLNLMWMPRFGRKNEILHGRLNRRLEQEIGIIDAQSRSALARHYKVTAKLRVLLSDREAAAYLVLGVVAASLFGFAIVHMAGSSSTNAGHIYSVITYLWTFVSSLDEAPTVIDQLARLKNIGKRVSANAAAPGASPEWATANAEVGNKATSLTP
ncbi:hypothetical protein FQV39_29980 (plasmid) [Bosea sp. F3-2]|uniref:ABC transporter six-transmembrane domain-containing protein n=1 Tax=Bosea sp. F3-2 TaxID=2599640 RepID=UPI0011ECC344|nr:ABC transporter six-transmembrane domain-containing protein [Bosea sp. F3-2]QEL26896.1 hypothetical protein FQV39_29980 [Bosea sp. F3-2]